MTKLKGRARVNAGVSIQSAGSIRQGFKFSLLKVLPAQGG